MPKQFIPKRGDKFKVFMFVLLPAYEGKVFVCTGRCQKDLKPRIKAKRLGDKKSEFALDRCSFIFVKVQPKSS